MRNKKFRNKGSLIKSLIVVTLFYFLIALLASNIKMLFTSFMFKFEAFIKFMNLYIPSMGKHIFRNSKEAATYFNFFVYFIADFCFIYVLGLFNRKLHIQILIFFALKVVLFFIFMWLNYEFLIKFFAYFI